MRTGACYIRVSTDKQEELSPDAQKRLLYEYARDHQITLSPSSFYMDIGISGRKAEKRPAFREMIAAAKSREHPFDVILVWKFSRFARNQEESIVYKSLLHKTNVEVISVSEPLPDGIMGGLIERILEWMDEYFSIRLSGEVMRGMTEKAMRGGYMSCAPFGYNYENGLPPSINPRQASIVKLIFEKYVYENASKSAIARYLNLSGITTRKGRSWEAKSVEYILNNPFYIGKVRWNYTTHASGKRINAPNDWILAEGQHEPIISEELFKAAARKAAASSGPSSACGRLPAKHWLSGFLRCARCNGPMNYRSGRTNQTPAFYCKNQTLGTCSSTQRCLVPALEAAVLQGLDAALEIQSPGYIKAETAAAPSSDFRLHLEERLKETDQKEKRMRTAYLSGVETLEYYRHWKDRLEKERAAIVAKLEQFSCQTQEQSSPQMPSLTDTAQIWGLFTSQAIPLEAKCDAVRSICEKITYDKEADTLEFYFTV